MMDFQQGYCLDIKTDRDVNDIIKWWNDILFERGYVRADEFMRRCDLAPEFCYTKYCWSFELTTDYVKLQSRKDTYHVKSNWRIHLPEPEDVSKKELL